MNRTYIVPLGLVGQCRSSFCSAHLTNGRRDNPHTETKRECFDHKDNDGDGKSDCEDPDCTRDKRIRQRCQRMQNHHKKKKERGRACFDGKDNDHDGQKDCEDPNCRIYTAVW